MLLSHIKPMKNKAILFLSCFFFLIFTHAQVPELWGMTAWGGYGCGNIFTISGDGSNFNNRFLFDTANYCVNGAGPKGTLMQANNGKLYGMTFEGGPNRVVSNTYTAGTIFCFDPITNVFTKIKDLDSAGGALPFFGHLLQANDGLLYGMTCAGGQYDFGVIFRINPSTNLYEKIYEFNDFDGRNPYGSLIQLENGKLYGMACSGGFTNQTGGATGGGVIFSLDPVTLVYTKLFSFRDDLITLNYTGSNPNGSLIKASNGILYGITNNGGSTGLCGTLFSFDPVNNNFSNLYDIDPFTIGCRGVGSLVEARNGILYGVTVNSIFSYDISDSLVKRCHSILNDSLGNDPWTSMYLASDGNLYGMLAYGGEHQRGVAYRFNPHDSSFNKIMDFDGTTGYNACGSFIEIRNSTDIHSTDLIKEFEVSIYPNPAKHELSIVNGGIQINSIRIYNTTGQLLLDTNQPTNNTIDVSGLNSGIYLAEIKTLDKSIVVVRRFVKM